MKHKKMRRLIIITILIALGIVYYYYLSSKTVTEKPATDPQNATREVTKLINKDFDTAYPKTPRQVVKMYSRIITCLYKDEYNDDEKKLMAVQARKLMDDELLEHNDFDEYYDNMCQDIKDFRSEHKIITSYILDSSKNVVYKTLQEKNYAFVNCAYYMKGDAGTERSQEQYILRQDEQSNWKILYWKLYDGSEDDEDE